jgi:PEP-CTERM motif-containing protein
MRIVLISSVALLSTISASATTAFDYQTGSVGNQNWTHPLGMDFDVNSTITVTSLGVFDSGSDGLASTINAYIYNRDTQTAVASAVFATGNTGTLVHGERFLALLTPLVLNAGFHGSIVAEGYGALEPNGNGGIISPPFTLSTLDSGGGAISFVGTSRYSTTDHVYPNILDSGPANRYGAGTFQFAVGSVPEPGTLGLAITGLVFLGLLRRKRSRLSAAGQF